MQEDKPVVARKELCSYIVRRPFASSLLFVDRAGHSLLRSYNGDNLGPRSIS